MPQIVLYNRQAALPGSTQPFLENVEAKGKVGRATERVGQDLLKRAEERKSEQGTLEALETAQRLTDVTRQRGTEEEKLRGRDAEGGTQRIGQFVDDQVMSLSKDMDRDTREKFRVRAFQIRKSAMDSISKHEANEHNIRKQNSLTLMRDNWRSSIQGGDRTVEEKNQALTDMRATIDDIYKGYSTEATDAIKEKMEDEMTSEWLVERSIAQPALMLREIDDYKKLIPGKELKMIKGVLKQAVKEDLARNEFLALKAEHGDDYESMLKEASKHKDDILRTELETMVKSDYATYKIFEEDRNKKLRDEANKDIADAFYGGEVPNIALTEELLRKHRGVLGRDRYISWKNSIRDMTAQKIQNIENSNSHKYLNHPDNYWSTWRFIQKHGAEIDPIQITDMVQNDKLSIKEAQGLLAELKRYKTKGPSELQDAFSLIDKLEKEQAWKDTKAGKKTDNPKAYNNRMAIDLKERAVKLYETFADQDLPREKKLNILKDFLDKEAALIVKGRFDEAFRNSATRHQTESAGINPDVGASAESGKTITKPIDNVPEDVDAEPLTTPQGGSFDEKKFIEENFPGIGKPLPSASRVPEVKKTKEGKDFTIKDAILDALDFVSEKTMPAGTSVLKGLMKKMIDRGKVKSIQEENK
jgi:hypothetical protein